MKIASEELIADLVERTKRNLNDAEKLKQNSVESLNQRANPESWSALECIEHLNRYGDFYIPEMTGRIKQGSPAEENQIFKSGVIGNYFAKSLLPLDNTNSTDSGKTKPMKTFKTMNPINSELNEKVIDTFIHQQEKILGLLGKSRQINLRKTKTSISISKILKLRLGDTFRVVIYHNQRHLQQAFLAVK